MDDIVSWLAAQAPGLWVLVTGLGVLLVAGVVWYCAGLAALLTRRGAQGWRAWVPFLGEAELLEQGGVPGWSVAYLLVPGVALWGVVLRARAVHRVTVAAGRGTVTSLLGVLVPPVWAGLLGWGGSVRVAPAVGGPAESAVGTADAVARTAGSGGAPVPVAAVPVRAAQVPSPQVVAPGPMTPVVAPAPMSQGLAQAPIAQVMAPFPTMRAVPPMPPAPRATAPVLTPPVPPVQPVPPVLSPLVPPAPPAPPVPAVPVGLPLIEEPVSHTVVVPVVDEEWEGTVVVQPDPEPAPRWCLRLDDGRTYPLDRPDVVVGRRPEATDPSVQALAIDDATRTLSKQHARFTWDGGWQVTDLGSTNGIVLIEDGVERHLGLGATAQVLGRLRLGSVELEISRVDGR